MQPVHQADIFPKIPDDSHIPGSNENPASQSVAGTLFQQPEPVKSIFERVHMSDRFPDFALRQETQELKGKKVYFVEKTAGEKDPVEFVQQSLKNAGSGKLSPAQESSFAVTLYENLLEKGMFEESYEALKHAVTLNPKNNELRLALAHEYYDRKDYDLCIKTLEGVKIPKGHSALLYMGLSYFHREDYDNAIHALSAFLGNSLNVQNVKLKPFKSGNQKIDIDCSREEHNQPICMALEVLAQCYYRKANNAESLKCITVGLSLNPNSAILLELLTSLNCLKKSYHEAIKSALAYLKIHVPTSSLYMSLGEAYDNEGQPAEAIEAYKKALCGHDQLPKGVIDNLTARIFINLPLIGKFDEGFESYKKTLQGIIQQPFSFQCQKEKCAQLCSYALYLHKAKTYIGAIEACNRILAYNPGHVPITQIRALSYYHGGNPEHRLKAIADFTVCIDSNPGYADHYKMRGTLYRLIGKEQEALRDLECAFAINPLDKLNACHVGMEYFGLKNFNLAIARFTSHINDNDAPNIEAFIYRGWAYLTETLFDEALKDFLKAKSLIRAPKNKDKLVNSDLFILFDGLCKTYQGLNNQSAALECLNEGLSYCEGSFLYKLYKDKGLILQNMGRDKESLKAFEKAIKLALVDDQVIINSIKSLKEKLASKADAKEKEAEDSAKATSDETELSILRDELSELKEQKQKRLEEKLEREKLKKKQEAEELARKELEDEIERRRKKFEPHLVLSSQPFKKVPKKVAKQDFSGTMDWWKDEAKMKEMFASVPSQTVSPAHLNEPVVVVNSKAEPGKVSEPHPLSPASPFYKPSSAVYHPQAALAGYPINLSPSDRDRLITAERMIMHGIEDLLSRAYGEKPYYDLTNEIHRTLVKQGFLYYILRTFEALHPSGRTLTKEEHNFISMVNNFVIDAEKARELRHQIRNQPHLITLSSLHNFAKFIKDSELLANIKCLLNANTFPKDPKPMQLKSLDLYTAKNKSDWDNMKIESKIEYLLHIIIQQFKHMKAYIKPIEDKKEQFIHEGEIQNALKMSIAIIGKCLSMLKFECDFKHPLFYSEEFKVIVKHGNDVGHKIGDDLEFYEFDEISPHLMFEIATKADALSQSVANIKRK